MNAASQKQLDEEWDKIKARFSCDERAQFEIPPGSVHASAQTADSVETLKAMWKGMSTSNKEDVSIKAYTL